MGAAEASRGAKWIFDLVQKGKGGKWKAALSSGSLYRMIWATAAAATLKAV